MTQDRPPVAPGGRVLLGHTLTFLRDPLRSLEEWGETDHDVVRASVGGKRVSLATSPAAVRQVLVTDDRSYRKAEVVRDRLGTLQGGSLVLLEGEEWRERRRQLRSAFAPDRVASTAAVTTREASASVTDWPTDGPVRVDERCRDLSLTVLARTLFGLELAGGDTPIHDAADDVMARMDLGSVSTYLPEWVPTPTNRRFRRAVETLNDRLDARVNQRARRDGAGDDLPSTLLSAGLPEERVRDELIAFLFAGFDSTATALSCTLGSVAGHPDVQSALHAELDARLDGGAPSSADLSDLPYLDAVVHEALRLYPPQYLLFREQSEPVDLQGYRVDPGTVVVLPPWILHRQGRYWDDPETFRPDRWLVGGDPMADADRPEYAYFPYGGGPRHCLGVRLTNQLLRLVVAVLCRHRRLELLEDLSVRAGPTLSLDGGVVVRAQRRD